MRSKSPAKKTKRSESPLKAIKPKLKRHLRAHGLTEAADGTIIPLASDRSSDYGSMLSDYKPSMFDPIPKKKAVKLDRNA